MIEPEKGHQQKTTGNIMLSGEGPNSFPLNSETRKDLEGIVLSEIYQTRKKNTI